MQKALIKGALIGGVIAFAWAMVSWMVLPWHKMSMNKFTNEQQVVDVIKQNAPVSGIYVLPGGPCCEKKSNAAKGPFMFANVKLEGMDYTSLTPFVRALIIQIIAAFLVTWILLHAKAASYAKKVGFVTLIGLVVGLLGKLPDWNWMGVPLNVVVTCMADLVIAWFLAGLAIAKWAKVKGK